VKYSEYFGAKRRLSLKNENIRYDTTSLDKLHFKVKLLHHFFTKQSCLNEEPNCIRLLPQLVFPGRSIPLAKETIHTEVHHWFVGWMKSQSA
jgi:hypothetical protein